MSLKVDLVAPNSNFSEHKAYLQSSLMRFFQSENHFIQTFIRFLSESISKDFVQGKRKGFLIPPYNLLLVAGLTPPDIEVSLFDERIEQINFNRSVDLVALSVTTKMANRAYEIANEYRKQGIKVVMGGYHPTALPHETAQYADAVIIGEAEGTWPQLIKDLRKGKLQKFYKNAVLSDLTTVKSARRDLLEKYKEYYLTTNVIQATRGCPNHCEFCSVHLVSGCNHQRFRPIRDVVDEISTFSDDIVIFMDDNLMGNKQYARELFNALIPLKIKWFGEITLSSAQDEELLDIIAESGCFLQVIGIESLSQITLNRMQKKFNRVNFYREFIKRIHERRIAILGSIILGLDNDNISIFDKVVDFLNENYIENPNINILFPYPGTPLFNKMKKEQRILSEDWSLYDTASDNVVFQPKNMSSEELQEGYNDVIKRVSTISSIYKRTFGTKNLLIPSIHYNLQMRKERTKLFTPFL